MGAGRCRRAARKAAVAKPGVVAREVCNYTIVATWTGDPRKAEANRARHGVGFDLAALVFDDPLALSVPDPHPDGDRWRTIGRPMPDLPTLLLVVHTEPGPDGEPGRIVSARRATRHERRANEDAI